MVSQREGTGRRFCRAAEAASRLELSPHAVEELVDRADIIGCRAGGEVWVERKAITDWLTRRAIPYGNR